jgi:hypothetical protein
LSNFANFRKIRQIFISQNSRGNNTPPPFDWHLIVNIHPHAMDQVLLIAHLPRSSLMTSIQTSNYFLVLCFAIEWGLLCTKDLSLSFGVLPLSS